MNEKDNNTLKNINKKIDLIEKENTFLEDEEAKKLAVISAKKYLDMKKQKRKENS